MFQLDLKSRKSIHEQVVDNLRGLIVSGALAPGEKLPSVRDLSKTLTVNPNTIQKSYRELESRQYIYTVSGLGTFAADVRELEPDVQKISAIKARLQAELAELFYLGLPRAEIDALLRDILAHLPDSVPRPPSGDAFKGIDTSSAAGENDTAHEDSADFKGINATAAAGEDSSATFKELGTPAVQENSSAHFKGIDPAPPPGENDTAHEDSADFKGIDAPAAHEDSGTFKEIDAPAPHANNTDRDKQNNTKEVRTNDSSV